MCMFVGPLVKHAMIITEYMENGALDRYLRVSAKQQNSEVVDFDSRLSRFRNIKIFFPLIYVDFRITMGSSPPSSWWACCAASLQE